MGKMRIREASSDDLDFLVQLESNSFSCHRKSTRRSLRNSLTSATQQIFLLEKLKNSQQSCSIGAATVLFYKRSLRIYSIAIHPEYRGHGMGRLSATLYHGRRPVTRL